MLAQSVPVNRIDNNHSQRVFPEEMVLIGMICLLLTFPFSTSNFASCTIANNFMKIVS